MKRIALVCFLSLLFPCSQAQNRNAAPAQKKDQPGTALEAFMGKRGRMIVKDSYSIGRFSGTGGIQMDALVIYEPNNPTKIKGLRAEVTESGELQRSNTSFIDFDELESLSQALAYMADLSTKWKGQQHEPYTEIIYTSKGELEVGFYQQGTKASAFCRSGSIGSADAFFNLTELPKMKELVDKAITLLKSK
jgi:hypothetical protein